MQGYNVCAVSCGYYQEDGENWFCNIVGIVHYSLQIRVQFFNIYWILLYLGSLWSWNRSVFFLKPVSSVFRLLFLPLGNKMF